MTSPQGPDSPDPFSTEAITGYTEDGSPTFDHIRDKIEQRAATAIGAEELAEMTPEAHEARKAFDDREEAARKKLDEIRKSMGG